MSVMSCQVLSGQVEVFIYLESSLMKIGRFKKHEDTLILENLLRHSAEGETVTYADMSTKLGKDVRKNACSRLATARKCVKDDGIFFDVIDNVGLIRLSVEESLSSPKSHLKKAERAAKVSISDLRSIDINKLSDEGKKKYLSTMTQAGAVAVFASSSAEKRIKQAISDKPIAFDETLKLF